MIAEMKSFSFNETNGDMDLEIYSDFDVENLQLLWQKRQDSSSLSLYEGKFFDCVKNDNIIKMHLNINDIIDAENIDQKDEIMWDCFVTNGIKKISVSFQNTPVSKYNYHFFETNNLFKIVPYVTAGSKTLALYLRSVNIECSIGSLVIQDGKINGKISINSEDLDAQKLDLTLCYRKREYKDIFNYIEDIDANVKIDSFVFEHDINGIFSDKLEDFALWDSFVRVENELSSIYIPATIQSLPFGITDIPFKNNSLHQIIPSINEKNCLTLNIKQKVLNAIATSVIGKENNVVIKGTVPYDHLSNYRIVSKLRREVGTSFEYYTVFEKSIEVNEKSFDINVSIDDLIQSSKEKDILDLCIRCENALGHQIDLPLFSKNKEKIGTSKAALFVNGSGNYSIWINVDRQPNEKVTNIAVLGTCYSRNAFNTIDYFSPKYKKLYKCGYTQFHSNIISLVSDPVEFNRDDFTQSELKEADINHLKSDFEKSFFENLKEIKPEYLVIDLYVDACREVIEMGDNSYVTLNYMIPQTAFYKKLKGKKVISHYNVNEYFELWEKSLEKFIERLLPIIPEDRIILNRGRLTPKYKDANNKLVEFPEKEIKRNNYIWDRLENCFLHHLPNVKIIDMRKTKYTGYFKHPFGNSYAHYESDYYKEFIFRLNEIVLEDKNK
ncbi:DUF6270 domain-containing protein [Bacillus paramycoides]|uniref:DUF6270 domain-containing protein n=1 Tax=Bacillus paramycoides TaxID=2026194 RepID=UPI002E24C06D|nr:DUF6270 domain-containing protein [Bacillus paramycoides]